MASACSYQVLIASGGAEHIGTREGVGALASVTDAVLTLDNLWLLASALPYSRKVSKSYWPGLFVCYERPAVPRTNNDLEQCFGRVRYHERRASGRKGAAPGLVVRGSVRLVAAVVTRTKMLTGEQLRPADLQQWRQVRATVAYRQQARSGRPRSSISRMGERWGVLTQDRPTRFVIAASCGPSEDTAAPAAVCATRERSADHAGVPWLRDGRVIYATQVRWVYRNPPRTGRRGRPRLLPTPGVALTQVVKQRRGRRLVRVEVRPVIGPVPACPYTVHIERLNGVLRDQLNCLTRKTPGLAKATPTWDALVGLALLEQNWLRAHPELREPLEQEVADGRRYQQRSPAMAIGLTDHLWSWEEVLWHPVYQYHLE